MSQLFITLLVLFSVQLIYGYPGDSVMTYLPPYQLQPVDSYPSYPYISHFQAKRHIPQPQNQVLHTKVKNPLQAPFTEKQSNQNITFGDFLEALNEVSQHTDEQLQQTRIAAPIRRDENQAYSSLHWPMGYSRPNYALPPIYHDPKSVTELPSLSQPKVPLLKPDLSSLLSPVAAKAPSKLNGLFGLIFSLLSAKGGLPMTGLKDVLIEGIIKPLLIAKGGIKALVAKLSIPIISLVLINLEVLITVWWLWEECPAKLEPLQPAHAAPSYSKPAYSSNYNSYG